MSDLEIGFLSQLKAQRVEDYSAFLHTQGVYADWLEDQGDIRSVLLRVSLYVRQFSPDKWHRIEPLTCSWLSRFESVQRSLTVSLGYPANFSSWQTKSFIPTIAQELQYSWSGTYQYYIWTERSLVPTVV